MPDRDWPRFNPELGCQPPVIRQNLPGPIGYRQFLHLVLGSLNQLE
jgi:hypothetical protein